LPFRNSTKGWILFFKKKATTDLWPFPKVYPINMTLDSFGSTEKSLFPTFGGTVSLMHFEVPLHN
jgi:hypothetical protein